MSDDDLKIEFHGNEDEPTPKAGKDSWLDVDVLRQPKPKAPLMPTKVPGFGFGMALVWCLVYFFVMQVLVGIVLVGIPLMLIASGIAQGSGPPPQDNSTLMDSPVMTNATLILLIITHLAGGVLGWFMLRYLCGKQWKRKIALSRAPSGTHIALLLLGFPAMIALAVGVEAAVNNAIPSTQEIVNWFIRDPHKKFSLPGVAQFVDSLKSAPFGLVLVAVAVVPALNEELWCRGFLNHGMAARYRSWVVVALTSFLFGCLHVEPRQAVGVMFLGAAIHAAYLTTRSLWVAIGLHFANNGLQVLHINTRMEMPILKPYEEIFEHQPTLFLTSAAVLFAAVAYALYQTRCKLVLNTEQEVSFWRPVGPASAELPPENSATMVEHEPLSILSMVLVLVGAVTFGAVVALH